MRIKSNRIGTVGAAMLLAGSLALAGDTRGLAQNENDRAAGAGRSVAASFSKGGVVELERKYPESPSSTRSDICGPLEAGDKCRPRPQQVVHDRYVGACLPYPILGRLFCWS